MYYVFQGREPGVGCKAVSSESGYALSIIAAFSISPPENSASQADEDSAAAKVNLPGFETILRSFHKRIYNLAYRLLGDFDEAADLTQETFIKAYGAYARFRGAPEGIYPWLCRIAVNSCKNRFKQMSRRSQYEALSLDEPLEAGDSTVELDIGDESADPASIFAQAELGTKIQEAIQALPPEFRVVVILRDMQGLSYKELVEATGLTMETVKTRLFRARGMLRRRLGPYLAG